MSITVWDTWGRRSGVQGEMVVLRPATATPLPPAAPVARHTGLTGHAPPWAKTVAVGVLFAGIVAALAAAYYRRKLAAWRARLNAYLLARKLAMDKAPKESGDTPLPRETHLLIDGEVPLEGAAEGRVPQPGPPRPDGSYTPHGLRDGYAHSQPIDLAAWKQQDYANARQDQTQVSTECPQPRFIISLPLIWYPKPCQTINPVGKAFLVGFIPIAAAELFSIGGEALSAAPISLPVSLLALGAGAWLTMVWWNIVQTPTHIESEEK